jgi:hypothetical protein
MRKKEWREGDGKREIRKEERRKTAMEWREGRR